VDRWLTEKLMRLLTEPLYCSWNPGRDFVVSADVGLFFTAKEPPLVPDVMLSLDIRVGDLSQRQNLSYFVWIVGKVPEVVIEIVSNREGGEDDRKLRGYARMGIPYYVIYDPERYLSQEVLRAFALQQGQYEPVSADWLPAVGLGLKLWHGTYEAHERTWLRWCDQQGRVIPTGAEAKLLEQRNAEQERQRADRLAQLLRQQGIDPDKV
jgi:Uma2 family endonuclease